MHTLRSTRLTHKLLLSTALVSVGVAASSHASAQTLPDLANAGGASVSTTGPSGTRTTTVDLNGANRVVEWNSFDVGGGGTVAFTSTTNPGGGPVVDSAARSVLNRVIGLNPSQINGAITGQSNIAVWLVNGSGITFGPTGSFNGGSLVLSTLNISAADFNDGNATVNPNSLVAGSIDLQAGVGQIQTAGGLIAVAPSVTSAKSITASGTGEVALIAATDVTMPFAVGGPLSFTINAGTTVGSAQVTGGTIAGASVRVGASSNIVAGLLNVDSGATLTATNVNGVIVLKTRDGVGDGINIAAPSVGTNIGSINAAGTLGGTGFGASSSVTVRSASAASVTGGVNAGGNYTVLGSTVSLGGTQAAGGTVDITSTAGSISGTPGLSLTSASTGAGGPIYLDASAAVDLSGSTLNGGPARQSSIGLRAGGDVTLGAVNALSIGDANVGHTAVGASLALGGPATFGDISTTSALSISTTGDLTTGTVNVSNGGLTLSANTGSSDLSTGAIGNLAAIGGGISLNAARDAQIASANGDTSIGVNVGNLATITGAVTARGGGYSILAAAVNLGGAGVTQQATGAVDINATGSGGITGAAGMVLTSNSDNSGGGNLYLDATAGAINFGAGSTLNGGTTRSADIGIRLATGGNLTLGNVNAATLGSTDAGHTTVAATLSTAPARLGAVSLGNVNLTNAASIFTEAGITTGTIDVSAGGVALNTNNSTTGDIATGAINTTAAVQINAANNAVVASAHNTGAGVVSVSALNGSVRAGQLSADNGDVAAAGADVTGLAGASTGTSDAAFGRLGINAGGLATVTAAGLAQLGTVSAAGAVQVTGGSLANGSIDATSVTSNGGAVTLSAFSNSGTLAARDGEIRVGSVEASGTATLNNRTGAGAVGNILVSDHVTGGTGVSIIGASNLLITEYTGGATGRITANSGNIGVNVTNSIYGLTGSSTMVSERGVAGVSAAGNLTVNATGDVRVDQLASTGGNISLNIDGSLTGTSGTLGTAISGGALFAAGAAQNIMVLAGGGANVARFNTVQAGNAVSITAGNVAVGTLSAGGTTMINGTNAFDANNSYVGLLSAPGDLTLNLGGLPSVTPLVSVTDQFDTAFGRTGLSATGGTITGTVDGAAQISTMTAGGQINVTAGALGASSATSTGGLLNLVTTVGTLALGTGSANTTATLTKQNGALATAGDDLRVTSLTAGAGATILGNTHARVGNATTSGGDVSVTATMGDVNGGPLATDRANLTATASTGRVLVSAAAGTARLGTITAGSGATISPADQVLVNATGIDVTTATATNGNLVLTANAGDVALGTGTAKVNATITASQNARVGSLTAQTGNAAVTATNGDVTGAALVASPALAALVSTTGTLTADAGAANIAATAGSVTVQAGNAAQLGTVTAGNAVTGTAKALVAVNATAGTGALGLTASQGTLALGDGGGASVSLTKQAGAIATAGDDLRVTGTLASTAGNTTILSNTHARIANAVATGGDLNVTAALGDVNGGLAATDRANLAANSANARVIVNAANGTALLGTVTAGAGAGTIAADQVTANARAVDATEATAVNGNLVFTATAGDAALGMGVAKVNASITASQSARIGSLTAQTGNAGVTATAGDVTGGALVTNPSLATLVSTTGTLTPQAGAANIAATVGAVTVTAGNAAQLGSVAAGTSVGVNAKAIVANSATATSGALGLTASQGTLALGTGSAGAGATLTKQGGSLAAAGDDLRVTGSLIAGAANGQVGGATLTSSTHVRASSVEARGGSITVSAIDGEVTGAAGGRADLTAALARNVGGAGIAGSDQSISVTSGLASRLGTLSAGDNIAVAAGSNSGAARDGSIDLIEATTTRGNLTLDVFNDNAATTGGIALARTTAAGRNVAGVATLRTAGSNGGAIVVSDTINATRDVIADGVSDVNLLHAIAGETIAVRAGGGAASADFTAGEDIGVTAAGAIGIGTLSAGDDVDLTGSSVSITSATATGVGSDTSAVDFTLSPTPIAGAERGDRGNANITLRSTSGAIAVSGDLTAQRNVTVGAAGLATLSGNVTAGAPLGGVVIAGNYTVNGAAVTLGDANAKTQQASGAVAVTASGALTQSAGRLTLTSNSDRAGTEGLTLSGNTGVTLANSALIGGSTVGRESEVRVTSSGGAVSLGKVDAQALNIRANSGIAVAEAIEAGNAVRAADPVAGGSTVDLATTTGAISLLTAAANGAGHDIVLSAPAGIGATSLVAGRDVRATSSAGTISVPVITAGRDILATAGGDVIVTTGNATRNIAVDAGQNSRSGSLGAGGAVSVVARSGDATGSAGASTGTSDASFGRAAMTAGTTLAVTATGLVQLGAAQGGTGLTITAGDATHNGAIDATSVKTLAGNALLDARATSAADTVRDGKILVGDATAAGDLTLTNVARGGTVGDIAVANRADAGGALLLDGARDVSLPLGTATGAGTVRALRDASATSLTTGNTATLTAGGTASSTLLRSTGANVVADGGTVSLGTADANASLAAVARSGDLTLAAGTAGTTATLSTVAPGVGDVIISTSLTSGQSATITSVSDARLASVKAATGDVRVTATGGEVTGVGAGAANIEATAGAVQIDAGNLARLGTLTAGTTLAVTGSGAVQIAAGQAGAGLSVIAGSATSDGAIDATSLKTNAGNLLLDARSTSNADATRDGHISVGDATAAGNLTLTNAVRGGTSGDISVGNRADAGGALLIDSARDAVLPLGTAGTTGTVNAVRNANATSLTSAGAATLTAEGAATSSLLRSTGANIVVTGASATLGTADARTSLTATARTGDLTLATGTAGTTATLTTAVGGSGDVIVTTGLTSGQATTVTSVSDARLANVKATAGDLKVTSAGETTGVGAGAANLEATVGAVQLDTGSIGRYGAVTAGTSLTATAKGDLSMATGTAGTTATLTTTANAGDVIVSTGLTSGQAATITSVSDARLASVKATTGALKVAALSGEVAGIGAGAANLEATAGSLQVDGGTLTRLGTVRSGTTLAVTGDTVTTGALTSGGTTSLIADAGALTVASATSTGDVTLSTTTLATLGGVTATGRKLTLTAADAAVDGAIVAQRIEVLNKSAGNALRLGDSASGTGGFELTTAEVNRLNSAEILLDAGTASGATAQDVAIGTLALDADSGSSKFDVFGTKRIDVTGAFTATGSATTRTIRFGGSASDAARASVIRVAATDAAGGRIDVGDATLELRGAKVGVGQDAGFLQSIGLTAGGTPLDSNAVATQYVGNANSSLYAPGLGAGGRPYVLNNGQAPSLVTARSMTVRFTDYALFQNTASAGKSGGVILGGTAAAPVTPALRLIGPNPPDAGAVALFGSVNGTMETGTALLGPTVIDVIAVNRANSRINGCVIGASGGGCIASLISQPILGVFDASKADVFRTADDFELPFDPVVGTNNESLFGDVGTYGLGDVPLDLPPCPPDDQTCIQAKKDQK